MADDSWQRVRTLAERQGWLVTAEQAYRCGTGASDVERRIRRGECRSLLRGVYLLDPDLVTELPEPLRWRAALLAHGPHACLVAGSGARALGLQGMPPGHTIEVAVVGGVPRQRRRPEAPGDPVDEMPEVVVRQLPVTADEVVRVAGLPVRRAEFTVVDAALDLDRMQALAVMDSALHQSLLTTDELAAAVAAARGRPGIQQLRPLAELADGRAESPLESRCRLICIDGDLAPDDLQYEVCDRAGHRIAVGDLAWHRRRKRPLLAEADGEAVHGLPQPVFRDRRRGNLLVPELCDTVRFVWSDTLRPAYVLYVVRSALAAA